MGASKRTTTLSIAACGATLLATTMGIVAQQAPPAPGQAPGGGRGGGRGGGVAPALFTAADVNKDGTVSRDELKATFEKWFADADSGRAGSLTQDQLLAGLTAAFPPPAPGGGGGRGAGGQNQTPRAEDVDAMMKALPDAAPVKPKQARKVLVLGKAAGFVHSSIPLAAKTIDALGTKTGAWSTAITYDPADINAQNLKQYDLVFLDSTTGAFLDDPNNQAATDARRKALLDFVRSGKGLAGIHAASDSYHRRNAPAPTAEAGAARGGRGGFGGRGGGTAGTLAPLMLAQGDSNADQKLSKAEMSALADVWFDKIDPQKSGTVAQADFGQRFAAVMPPPAAPPAAGRGPRAAQSGPDGEVGTWPEFNKMIGGFFKFHWVDPQIITYKIDDPKSPLTAMFKGATPFVMHDETYTFGTDTYSRENLHVLTSIDYSKMSDEDKAKEDYPRPDHDFALSWIRREGNGRVFYVAHGHAERNYAVRPFLEHILAGTQYALGDLKADDSPSVRPGSGTKTSGKQ